MRLGGIVQRSRFRWQQMRYRAVASYLRMRFPTEHEAQVNVNGYRLIVHLNTSIGNQLYIHGSFEPRETSLLRAVVAPDDVVVDIGANVGYYTLLFASLARKGRVIAFEPIPEQAALIERSLAANGHAHAVVHRLALSREAGEASFCVSRDKAFSSLIDTGRVEAARSIRVKTQTLDGFLATEPAREIGLLKIDVEGAEAMVIEGAARTLASGRVKRLMVEMSRENLEACGATQAEIDDRLIRYGYRGWCFEGQVLRRFSPGRGGRSPNVFYTRGDDVGDWLNRLTQMGIAHEEDHAGDADAQRTTVP